MAFAGGNTATKKLSVVLDAQTGPFVRGLANAARAMGSFASSLTKAQLAAAAGAVAIGAGLLIAVRRSLVAISALDAGLREIGTLTGQTVDQLSFVRDELLRLSTSIARTPEDLASGLYQVVSAGFTDTQEALDILAVAARSAVAGLTDTRTAVDSLTTVLNAFNLEAVYAQQVSDVLFATVRDGKLTFEELATSIGNVATSAGVANIGIEETAAAVATLTKAGLNANKATTALNSLIISILNPTEDVSSAAVDLGIQWNEAALRAKGLSGVMAELREVSAGSASVVAQLVPAIRSFRAAAVLAGTQGEEFEEILSRIQNTQGAVTKAFYQMNDALDNQKQLLSNQINRLWAEQGVKILPRIIGIYKQITRELQRGNEAAIEYLETTGTSSGRTAAFLLKQQRLFDDQIDSLKRSGESVDQLRAKWDLWIETLDADAQDANSEILALDGNFRALLLTLGRLAYSGIGGPSEIKQEDILPEGLLFNYERGVAARSESLRALLDDATSIELAFQGVEGVDIPNLLLNKDDLDAARDRFRKFLKDGQTAIRDFDELDLGPLLNLDQAGFDENREEIEELATAIGMLGDEFTRLGIDEISNLYLQFQRLGLPTEDFSNALLYLAENTRDASNEFENMRLRLTNALKVAGVKESDIKSLTDLILGDEIDRKAGLSDFRKLVNLQKEFLKVYREFDPLGTRIYAAPNVAEAYADITLKVKELDSAIAALAGRRDKASLDETQQLGRIRKFYEDNKELIAEGARVDSEVALLNLQADAAEALYDRTTARSLALKKNAELAKIDYDIEVLQAGLLGDKEDGQVAVTALEQKRLAIVRKYNNEITRVNANLEVQSQLIQLQADALDEAGVGDTRLSAQLNATAQLLRIESQLLDLDIQRQTLQGKALEYNQQATDALELQRDIIEETLETQLEAVSLGQELDILERLGQGETERAAALRQSVELLQIETEIARLEAFLAKQRSDLSDEEIADIEKRVAALNSLYGTVRDDPRLKLEAARALLRVESQFTSNATRSEKLQKAQLDAEIDLLDLRIQYQAATRVLEGDEEALGRVRALFTAKEIQLQERLLQLRNLQQSVVGDLPSILKTSTDQLTNLISATSALSGDQAAGIKEYLAGQEANAQAAANALKELDTELRGQGISLAQLRVELQGTGTDLEATVAALDAYANRIPSLAEALTILENANITTVFAEADKAVEEYKNQLKDAEKWLKKFEKAARAANVSLRKYLIGLTLSENAREAAAAAALLALLEDETKAALELAQAASQAARAFLQFAQAIGAVGDEGARTLGAMTELGSAIAQIAISGPSPLAITSLISSGMNLLGSLLGSAPSEDEIARDRLLEESKEALKSNSDAIRRLKESVDSLAEAMADFPQRIGQEFDDVWDRTIRILTHQSDLIANSLRDFGVIDRGYVGGLPTDQEITRLGLDRDEVIEFWRKSGEEWEDVIVSLVRQGQGFVHFAHLMGLSITDLEDAAEAAGVEIPAVIAAMEEWEEKGYVSADVAAAAALELEDLNEAIDLLQVNAAAFFKTLSGATAFADLQAEFMDLTDSMEDQITRIDLMRAALKDFGASAAEIASLEDPELRKAIEALFTADISTPEGRTALDNALRYIAENIQELPAAARGGMSLEDFIDFIRDLEGGLDDLLETAGEGPDSTSFQVFRGITEITGNRILGVMTTDAYWNRITALSTAELVEFFTGTNPFDIPEVASPSLIGLTELKVVPDQIDRVIALLEEIAEINDLIPELIPEEEEETPLDPDLTPRHPRPTPDIPDETPFDPDLTPRHLPQEWVTDSSEAFSAALQPSLLEQLDAIASTNSLLDALKQLEEQQLIEQLEAIANTNSLLDALLELQEQQYIEAPTIDDLENLAERMFSGGGVTIQSLNIDVTVPDGVDNPAGFGAEVGQTLALELDRELKRRTDTQSRVNGYVYKRTA